ncbi:MAG: DUF4301 family protein, partial [Bacteroidales bacterium]|nr:DUF4301 family protein [Bacteroidales bacterium]
MFEEKDLRQIHSKEITLKSIKHQIDNFKKGFPYIVLVQAATNNNGLIVFSKDEINRLSVFYSKASKNRSILKFVPASGAASRMFKHLFEFKQNYNGTEKDYQNFISDKSFNSVYNFIKKIKNFAFYNDLKNVMLKDGLDIETCISDKNYTIIIDYLLDEKGLNYAKLPKGLLKFHKYNDYSRISIEEHLVEGANYCKDKNNKVALHFTISPEHKEKFIKQIDNVKDIYEKKFNVKYEINFSIQKPSTDTIAVDLDNNPFREADHSLLFRPGGHGALIENLNDIKGDIIFIKNIDNIIPDRLKEQTFLYKKVIGGILIELQQKIFKYLKLIDTGNTDDDKIAEITAFTKDKLNIWIDPDFN